MITIKSVQDIEKMKATGRVVEETLQLLERSVRVGITTEELNRIAEEHIRSRGAYPTCLNYNGFPKAICISVNDVVVHGIPGPLKLRSGDIMVVADVVKCLMRRDRERGLSAGERKMYLTARQVLVAELAASTTRNEQEFLPLVGA